MRLSSRWLPYPAASLFALGLLFVVLPIAARYWLGWSSWPGYVSDLGIGGLLLLLCYRRPLLAAPLAAIWALFLLSNAELVNAVGRMPEPSDLKYLSDPQFVSQSTQGSGLRYPLLAGALVIGVLACLLVGRKAGPKISRYAYVLPVALLCSHAIDQYLEPSEDDQWRLFNLPHKVLAEGTSRVRVAVEDLHAGEDSGLPPDIDGLSKLDLSGAPLLPGGGKARNVLIVTLEGIPGAYIAKNRQLIGSSYEEDLMPRLSEWAERSMTTPDYVLHSHQTIRGLYSMLCGDYGKLDSGTPKGVELLNSQTRNLQCLPHQMRTMGFRTHFLQGAGLRFMAKDQIMPHMGFQQTHGRDWFKNKPYLEFPWGMDDKAYFEGALKYVKQLRGNQQPWMLTLLTVGTHQPYSAPKEYLERYPTAKQAAIGYLDDAVADFLEGLEKQGVLKDTLVIVTSDESHGLENVRLASAWGFNLVLAPDGDQLPKVKPGVYGHVDLTTSVLDYFDLPVPDNIAGRSLFRDYATPREIMSYTNGLLRQHDGKVFTECTFQQVCRRYESTGFITAHPKYMGRVTGRQARLVSQRAALLDQSITGGQIGQRYQFANRERIDLKVESRDDWTDNLIGAQYLEMPKGTRTRVTLKIEAVRLDRNGAALRLITKEFDRNNSLTIPPLPALKRGEIVELSFDFDNPETRKAFSFHLLGEGRGAIRISDFSVVTEPLPPELVANQEVDSAMEAAAH
ncbi:MULTISPECIES: LTA synthase family protein [unclassified Pseudomonas]|uniref:LTA synthase family protein n=1 Tax=unclassified Pseudomonas TaxID=196821 RepID=UPI0024476004|nr:MULTISPECIES: LTA synthase family protein [unclassified Pseudomonas]MDG9922687.1 LTA synthase family protein [Pseudomonas sp. GD04045]MDH0033180.1 LTA synthase family protein [Pseudomonas sp. GD04019]